MILYLMFVWKRRRRTYLCKTLLFVPASYMSAFLHLLKFACLQEVIKRGGEINRGMD